MEWISKAWAIWCFIVLSWFILVPIFTFFSRLWRFIHKEPVNKKSIWEYVNIAGITNLVMIGIFCLLISGTFVHRVWQYVNRPNVEVHVYPGCTQVSGWQTMQEHK